MSLEVVVVKNLPTTQQFWGAIQRVVPRSFAATVARIRARAPHGKTGKLARVINVRVTPSNAGGVFGSGVQVEFVTAAPYGHLVERGHRIVARGQQRKGFRLSKDERRTRRSALLTRRASAQRFVPGQHFALQAFMETRTQAVAMVESGLKQELDR